MTARAPRTGPPALAPAPVIDAWIRAAAAFLASRLEACSGVEYRESFVESAHAEGSFRAVKSDWPDWYAGATSGPGKMEGAKIQESLRALADGSSPRTEPFYPPHQSWREARWIMERLYAARASGDRELGLEPARAHGGGGSSGVKQARLRIDRGAGEAVERVPLRLARGTMEQLRAGHRARSECQRAGWGDPRERAGWSGCGGGAARAWRARVLRKRRCECSERCER